MPRALPAGMSTDVAKLASFASIALLDLQTIDGSQYFWTDNNYSQYQSRLTGALQTYSPWLKTVGPLTLSRDFTTDGGDLIIQNLSGNTIDRDVAAALKSHEFEGALAILRIWLPLFADAALEFHGYISEQKPGDEEVTFRLLQLADFSQFNVAEDVISELCTWRYKSAQCGSTGSAIVCNKQFPTCKDGTHNAQERFNGVLASPPASAVVNPPPVVTTIVGAGNTDTFAPHPNLTVNPTSAGTPARNTGFRGLDFE